VARSEPATGCRVVDVRELPTVRELRYPRGRV